MELTERGEGCGLVRKAARGLITSLKPHTSSSLLQFFDVSELKYQEKDELLRVFKSWRATKAVNAQALWDYRAKSLRDRYDFRKNLMDGYHMRLSSKGAKEDPNVIKYQVHRSSRPSGGGGWRQLVRVPRQEVQRPEPDADVHDREPAGAAPR